MSHEGNEFMQTRKDMWELTVLDAGMPARRLDSLAAADIDGDGRIEMITGGDGLFWYRPDTNEWGKVSDYYAHVGVLVEDIDGDGALEIVLGEETTEGKKDYMLSWYKPQPDLRKPWKRTIIDGSYDGHVHDLLSADMDGDGEKELVTISCYSPAPGIHIFKRKRDLSSPWTKSVVSQGIFTEGLAIGDVNGDGRFEIICGPDWYARPAAGAMSGLWERHTYAPNFREMCRTALLDITGNGSLDIVIAESEYMDGRLSWFENRMREDREHPWIEHRLQDDLYYAHSLGTELEDKAVKIMVAEMDEGGWHAPYNYRSRVILYSSSTHGRDWEQNIVYEGEGTHQAILFDIDDDGETEVVGKAVGIYNANPRMQIWDRQQAPSPLASFLHQFVDRDKPGTGVDILSCDIDGDGLDDIICGSWWYKNPGWERFAIPGVVQVINSYDLDHDGRTELIAIKAPAALSPDFYQNLSSELCWLKAVDPVKGIWEEHDIGRGSHDWPHGSVVAPLLPNGKLGLVIGFHSAYSNTSDYPELFEIPDDPASGPWTKRVLAEIQYGEEFSACDLTGNGLLDIVAGPYWLENLGTGTFKPYRFAPEGFYAARQSIADISGNGRLDVVLGQEVMDFQEKRIPWSPMAWFECPADPRLVPWKMRVIDTMRCAHSLDVGDLDGDGELEIICGEHDPFWPYRSRCRVLVYKKRDQKGISWRRYTVDGRFEHHDGTKVFEIAPGRKAIMSHGWADSIYVHVWQIEG